MNKLIFKIFISLFLLLCTINDLYARCDVNSKTAKYYDITEKDLEKVTSDKNKFNCWDLAYLKKNLEPGELGITFKEYQKLYPKKYFEAEYAYSNLLDRNFSKKTIVEYLIEEGVTPDKARKAIPYLRTNFDDVGSFIQYAWGTAGDILGDVGRNLDVQFNSDDLGTFITSIGASGVYAFEKLSETFDLVTAMMRKMTIDVRKKSLYNVIFHRYEDNVDHLVKGIDGLEDVIDVNNANGMVIKTTPQSNISCIYIDDTKDDYNIDFSYLPNAERPIALIGNNFINPFMETVAKLQVEEDEETGEKTYMILNNGQVESNIAWNAKECDFYDFSDIVAPLKKCWICGVYDFLFNAISSGTFRVYDNLRIPIAGLLSVILAVWVAFQFFKKFMLLDGQSPDNINTDFMIKTLGKRIFVGAVVITALFIPPDSGFSIPGVISKVIVEPVSLLAGGYSKLVLSTVSVDTSEEGSDFFDCEYEPQGNLIDDEHRIFSKNTKKSFLCVLENMNKAIVTQMQLGLIIIQASAVTESILPDISTLLIGLSIVLVYFLIMIWVPFSFIQSILYIGVMFLMLPLHVLCWVFPATRSRFDKAIPKFIQEMIGLVILTIIVTLCIIMLHTIMGGYDDAGNLIISSLERGDVQSIIQKFKVTNVSYSQILFVGTLSSMLIKEASSIAGKFSGSLDYTINEKIKTFFTGVIDKFIKPQITRNNQIKKKENTNKKSQNTTNTTNNSNNSQDNLITSFRNVSYDNFSSISGSATNPCQVKKAENQGNSREYAYSNDFTPVPRSEELILKANINLSKGSAPYIVLTDQSGRVVSNVYRLQAGSNTINITLMSEATRLRVYNTSESNWDGYFILYKK